MKIIVLSDSFYADYSNCVEILKKSNRPYLCLLIEAYGKTFAIPIRHHVTHRYAFHTVGEAGLDYTKAVVIEKDEYILPDEVFIETAEWRIINRNEGKIRYGFEQYLHQYKRALEHKGNPRSQRVIQYSALQYFDF